MKGIVGQIDVVILEGRNLGNAVRPYCVVQLEKNEFVTKEGKGPNPEWRHGASFDVSRSDSEFSVSVWDRACSEDGKTEDFHGSCSIRPMRIEGKEQKVWLKLKGRDSKSIKGDIQIQFKYLSKENKPLGIEDFQLLKVIGRGNFGKVLQVRKKDTGRIYAMKIIRKEDILKRDEIEHTLSERKVLAQNDNPFLVQLKFSFQTPEKLYLVLDYVNGGELFRHLQREGIFSQERARFYAAELVIAIEHLHKYKIIYRDIKPENVLLDSNGHVALTDFGLAKTGEGDAATTFCGTAEYLAPEILKSQPYGKAVDWWSLGILIYEMLTGLPPFYSENTNLMYKKILFSELVFPPEVSETAQTFLREILNRDPDSRLGAGGAEEIKRHPFFADISWDKLAKKMIPSPYKPTVESETDVQNFDPQFTDEIPVDSPPTDTPLSDSVQEKFKGFTFIKEEEISKVQSISPRKFSPRLKNLQQSGD